MYRFLIVIEKANGNYSAYSPDLPGCVATGATREETEENMYQAIEMHIKGLRQDGLLVPESTSFAEHSGQRSANALHALLKAEQDRSPDYLRLANLLSALYPKESEEKRLLDAMLSTMPR